MKIVKYYKLRSLADEDRNYLMTKGIPSIIYGNSAPDVYKKNFPAYHIKLAVRDEHYRKALELLKNRYDSASTMSWFKDS